MKKYLLSVMSASMDVEEWEVITQFGQIILNPVESVIIRAKRQKIKPTIKNFTKGGDSF